VVQCGDDGVAGAAGEMRRTEAAATTAMKRGFAAARPLH
jgi:hypothetical protein